jgi:chromosome partitioning protein
LLPASLDLAGAEVEVARTENHLYQLRLCLEPLRHGSSLDFVILDCPPSLGILMSNALVAADDLLVPIQCEYYALEGLGLLMRVAGEICHGGINPDLGLCGLLMTMFDARTNLNSAVIRDVREHFQEVVFQTAIPRTIRFGEAPSHGQTILEYDPQGNGTQAYLALAEEVIGRVQTGQRFLLPAPESSSS